MAVMRDGMQRRPARGHFRGGLPYARVGRGARPLIAIVGLMLENVPPPGVASFMDRFLGRDFTVVAVMRRLLVHSSAHELSEPAKRWQLELARHAEQRRWRAVWAQLMSVVLPQRGLARVLTPPVVWTFAPLMALGAPRDPSDLVVTVEAEDRFRFRDRLGEIAAPTLVVAGERDTFYTPDLFRETAAGIPQGGTAALPGHGAPGAGSALRARRAGVPARR